MIIANFEQNSKSLKKDDYEKSFDVEYSEKGLKELLSKIKVEEDVTIVIPEEKMYLKVRFSKDFQKYIVKKCIGIQPLTPDTVRSDLQGLRSGTLNYVVYKPKNKDLLGEKCYLVANKEWQKWFIKKGDMALTLDDIKDLNFEKVVKIVFDGKDVKC